MFEPMHIKIVLILTIGLSIATALGYLSHRIKLSPIFGYLLAGYCIGPYSPGYVADIVTAEQLAEIGVVLMMFSAGMHFKWQDLLSVKKIAVPGAIGQTLVSALIATTLMYGLGWSLESGIVFGLAIGVASTMVLIRLLSDNHLLKTQQGHIAVGWLIVEDIITVVALLLIPTLAFSPGKEVLLQEIAYSIVITIFKFIVLIILMFTLGRRLVSYLLSKIVLINSQELFTLGILAITFIISVGSAWLFGTSIALGAFIAGMVIGQSKVHHLVTIKVTPLKDAFVVVFFLSVGMLFNPAAIAEHFNAFLGTLAIVLIAKPCAAFLISFMLKYPIKTALTIAVSLAQIGEFSFILSQVATKFGILPSEGYDIIVGCALVSISINPLLFKLTRKFERQFM
ncbi:MAG: hypothetical protein HKM07_01950 [Chlamydiae bacterium]|nr:hypothetical protein [Chlamydiota bacterium]